jgi:hypothetical protein
MEGDPGIMVNIRFLRVSIMLTAEAVSNFRLRRGRPTDASPDRKLPPTSALALWATPLGRHSINEAGGQQPLRSVSNTGDAPSIPQSQLRGYVYLPLGIMTDP